MGKAGMLVPPPCTPLRRLEMPDPPPPPRVLRLSPWDVPRQVWVLGFTQERIQERATVEHRVASFYGLGGFIR
ncbi:hypothetical protein Cadr_000013724 [Camelus dromedarius]|uniref:Uncharacterized protein n=1 Tax=Camelus dromedarius TaxID=9838 RepID=A0A5N4DB31_CAMDR|nr:hypothetical protein Cadr_000013724 [Camelus dromedarius]